MAFTRTCTHCGHDFPASRDHCPHCAWPLLPPNMAAAEDPTEVSALEARYASAMADLDLRGARQTAAALEGALQRSQCVCTRSVAEVHRLASSDRQLYATFYQLVEGGVVIPEEGEWDRRRRPVDDVLFPGYRDKIHFGALTLDGRGVRNYGPCALVLSERMVAHRSTVFDDNTVLWMERQGIRVSQAHQLPGGFRAPWQARGRLGLAKLADALEPFTAPASFAGLVLCDGETSRDDAFIEAHVYGPVSIRTAQRVRVLRDPAELTDVERAQIEELRELLPRWGVDLEVDV
jgi:hypothetical protein